MSPAQYISDHLVAPFDWGTNDCVLFAARWVKNKTGVDPLAGLPKWKTSLQAARVIRSIGGLEAAIDARLQKIDPRSAVDGDLAFYNGCVCIFSGSYIVGPGPSGLEFVRRSKAVTAWRVS